MFIGAAPAALSFFGQINLALRTTSEKEIT